MNAMYVFVNNCLHFREIADSGPWSIDQPGSCLETQTRNQKLDSGDTRFGFELK
jgi:hypothetical protein